MLSGLINNMFFTLAEAEAVSVGSALPSNWPSPIVIALMVALGLVCAGLTVIILMQKKRASGIGAAIAGSGETYFSKNKGKTFEGTLENYTKWGGVAFLVFALLINILM